MEGWQSLAECTGLENQQGFTPFGGSNPSPSAISFPYKSGKFFQRILLILISIKWQSNNYEDILATARKLIFTWACKTMDDFWVMIFYFLNTLILGQHKIRCLRPDGMKIKTYNLFIYSYKRISTKFFYILINDWNVLVILSGFFVTINPDKTSV